MSKRIYTNKDFVVKDIWDKKEFDRKDGGTGTVQKIINEDDKKLVIWDVKEDMKGLLKKGHKYHAAGITMKQNRDGYDEWHTGKYSVIAPLITEANKEFHHEVPDTPPYNAVKPEEMKPMDKPISSYTKKDLHDLIIHIGTRLDYIVEKLGWISANIELLEKKI